MNGRASGVSEKYAGAAAYAAAKARRGAMRAVISPLVRWPRGEEGVSGEGYTVIIACSSRLLPMIDANLMMIARQDLTDADAVLVVIDRAEGDLPAGFAEGLRRKFPGVPLRVLFYSARQAAVAGWIDWGWVYSWLSWSIGIGAARTRWAMLHDFDALLLDPGVLAGRYRACLEGGGREGGQGEEYVGVRYYTGNGITPDDKLVTTFELMFDAGFVRREFRPIDLFNNVRRFRGRRVEFDTFLHAQATAGRTRVSPVPEEQMVHPSQMICQYVDHVNGRRVPEGSNNLFLIPYYFLVGGDEGTFRGVLAGLERGSSPEVFGRPVDASKLAVAQARWIAKQAGRVERLLHGEYRPEVRRYFDLIGAACGAGEVTAIADAEAQAAEA